MNFLLNIASFLVSMKAEALESPQDIVLHHLTDKVISTGFIGKINETILSGKLFGIFDMRITRWVLMMWIAGLICFVVFIPAVRIIIRSTKGPTSRWAALWESLFEFIKDEIVAPNFDQKYVSRCVPFFATLFSFILFCNLLGLIPGMSTATGNLAVTAGLTFFTFVLIIGLGFVKHGPMWIVTGILPKGIPRVMCLMLWPIEVLGLFTRPFTLIVRLFANMLAGHIVIIIFVFLVLLYQSFAVGIASVSVNVCMYLLELLVAFIQAYVFTFLSAIFIGDSMRSH